MAMTLTGNLRLMRHTEYLTRFSEPAQQFSNNLCNTAANANVYLVEYQTWRA